MKPFIRAKYGVMGTTLEDQRWLAWTDKTGHAIGCARAEHVILTPEQVMAFEKESSWALGPGARVLRPEAMQAVLKCPESACLLRAVPMRLHGGDGQLLRVFRGDSGFITVDDRVLLEPMLSWDWRSSGETTAVFGYLGDELQGVVMPFHVRKGGFDLASAQDIAAFGEWLGKDE
jgi:hypothetical protein